MPKQAKHSRRKAHESKELELHKPVWKVLFLTLRFKKDMLISYFFWGGGNLEKNIEIGFRNTTNPQKEITVIFV